MKKLSLINLSFIRVSFIIFKMSQKENLKKINRSTQVSMVVNSFIAAIKLIVGHFSNSHSMVLDGIHAFSDLLTDFFVLFVSKLAGEGPDEEHPFGHGKIESVGTVALGGILMTVSGAMAYDSFLYFFKVSETPASYALYFALLSVVAKEFLFHYLIKVANEVNSEILKANAWHSRFDAFSSIVVVLGLIGGRIGLIWMEPLAGMIISLMIARVGVLFAWPALKDLADTSLPQEQIKEMKKIALSVPGVLGTHHLRSRKSGKNILIDVNVQVDERITVSEGHEISTHVVHKLLNYDPSIEDVTVHIDVENDLPLGSYRSLNELRYPLRDEIESLVKKSWRELGYQGDLISKIELHYLSNQIDIEIFLKSKESIIQSDIVGKIKMIPSIGEVYLWIPV